MEEEVAVEQEEKSRKRRKRVWRVALGVSLAPFALLLLLMILIYVPPVQNFLRTKAVSLATEVTGMDISVGKIGLRFPLKLQVKDVEVIQPTAPASAAQRPDTLLSLGLLSVRVQAWPLLRGQVEVDHVTLENVTVNSAGLMNGMCVQGRLGRFFLRSHGVDLAKEKIVLNDVELEDTQIRLFRHRSAGK